MKSPSSISIGAGTPRIDTDLRALRDKQITIESDLDELSPDSHPAVMVRFAEVLLRKQIDRYLRFESTNDDGTKVLLDEPCTDQSRVRRTIAVLVAAVLLSPVAVMGPLAIVGA